MSVKCEFCGQETDYMTVRQVSRLIGKAEQVVTRWCREGRINGAVFLPPIRGGRGSWRIPATAVLPLLADRAFDTPWEAGTDRQEDASV